MKPIIITCTLLIATLIFFGFRSNSKPSIAIEGIQFFSGTWQEALDEAKKENKYIFLDAYTSWCGPCKMMKNKTFTDKSVGEFYNKYFINVAIDMEKGEGPALSNKYGVEAYPTLIYLKPNGMLIGKAMGFRKAKEFLDIGIKASTTK